MPAVSKKVLARHRTGTGPIIVFTKMPARTFDSQKETARLRKSRSPRERPPTGIPSLTALGYICRSPPVAAFPPLPDHAFVPLRRISRAERAVLYITVDRRFLSDRCWYSQILIVLHDS